MSNIFKATSDILQEIIDDHKSITGITLSPAAFDDSTVIKYASIAGALSAITSLAQRVSDDFFPQTASLEALIKHLFSRSMPTQIAAQKSHGQILLTGTGPGLQVPFGTLVKRVSDGALYTSIQSGVTGSSGTIVLFFESVATGNAQNLDSISQPFTLATGIAGIQSACTNTTQFLDGRDIETIDEIRARILSHDQDDNSGGNEIAYETWAQEASNQVVTAKTIRLPRGPDSVDTYITAGTADIAAAVNSGQSVVRLPSTVLLDTVQAYVLARNPITDDHRTKAPIEIPFNVTFRYDLYTETPANRAYVDSVILKVIKIYIYQARPLDVLSPTVLERLVDQAIGDQISERSCDNFGGMVTHYTVPQINILTPGTISLVSL